VVRKVIQAGTDSKGTAAIRVLTAKRRRDRFVSSRRLVGCFKPRIKVQPATSWGSIFNVVIKRRPKCGKFRTGTVIGIGRAARNWIWERYR